MGCDLTSSGFPTFYVGVSIHAPAWGATRRRIWTCRLILVSIHAPAWGATQFSEVLQTAPGGVSIHAPAWGATFVALLSGIIRRCFNPRTRVGCDPITPLASNPGKPVSIHAPAWGATSGDGRDGCQTGVSIHAPAWGATSWEKRRSCSAPLFQSTHPRGVRPTSSLIRRVVPTPFQSTHPRGVRLQRLCQRRHVRRVSIHAPAWGATPRNEAAFPAAPCFNPRTRVGCDARRMV